MVPRIKSSFRISLCNHGILAKLSNFHAKTIKIGLGRSGFIFFVRLQNFRGLYLYQKNVDINPSVVLSEQIID